MTTESNVLKLTSSAYYLALFTLSSACSAGKKRWFRSVDFGLRPLSLVSIDRKVCLPPVFGRHSLSSTGCIGEATVNASSVSDYGENERFSSEVSSLVATVRLLMV